MTKLLLSDHHGEVDEHSSFDWMARCLRDCADVVVVDNIVMPSPQLKKLLIIVLERLALIEGTNGTQWDDFLPSDRTASPTEGPTALRYNVTVEAAADRLGQMVKTSAVTDVVCTAGLGSRARLIGADFDEARAVVLLRFYDPDRRGRVVGTDLVVDRTDETISCIFQTGRALR